MTDIYRYEADAVDAAAHDLPGLKARFLIEHLPDGAVVLDVGCGGGKMLRTISRYRARAVLLGCDVKEPAAGGAGFEFRSIDHDGRLPYDGSAVDVVLLFDVLEHVDEPRKLLDEIARVLRPGGLLIAFIPVEGEPLSWYHLFRLVLGQDLYVESKDHVQAFRHSEVEALLDERFDVEVRRYAYHFLGQLMDASFCALLRVGPVKRVFWTESPYHNRGDRPRSFGGRCLAKLLVMANAAAWAESTWLRRVRVGSAGLLVTARRPAA